MRAGFAIFALIGVLSGASLIAWQGFAAVGHALELAGFQGLVAICLFHAVPLTLCALAWRTLYRNPKPDQASFIWYRWMRDAGGEILGVVPASGEIISIRTMIARGCDATMAIAATVVDLTVEMIGQVAFTLLGLALLAFSRPDDPLLQWTLIGTGVVIFFAGGFFLVQRFGIFKLLEKLAIKLIEDRGWSALASIRGVNRNIHGIYADRPRIARAVATHFTAWIVGCGEAGIILYFMGVPTGFATLIMLESMTYALRSAAFFVPAAAGVQEGGYMLIGAALGIGPEFALALSLMKRARELTLGVTAILAWQWLEGRGLLRVLRLPRR